MGKAYLPPSINTNLHTSCSPRTRSLRRTQRHSERRQHAQQAAADTIAITKPACHAVHVNHAAPAAAAATTAAICKPAAILFWCGAWVASRLPRCAGAIANASSNSPLHPARHLPPTIYQRKPTRPLCPLPCVAPTTSRLQGPFLSLPLHHTWPPPPKHHNLKCDTPLPPTPGPHLEPKHHSLKCDTTPLPPTASHLSPSPIAAGP